MSKFRECKKFTKAGIGFCLGLYAMIVSIIAFQKWNAKKADFESLIENWEQIPYQSFSTTTSLCSSLGPNWEKIDTTPIDFPGANTFCECPHISGSFSRFSNDESSGKCNSTKIEAGCDTRDKVSSISLDFHKTTVCGKKIDDPKSNAFDRPRSIGNSSCPTGYQKCATPSVITSNTTETTCVPNGNLCPPWRVWRSVNSQVETSTISCTPPSSWDIGYKLCQERDGLKQPIVINQFFRKYPCAPGYYRTSSQMFLKSQQDCSKQDHRWFITGETDEPTLWASDTTNIPLYWRSRAQSTSYVYSYRLEIGWSHNCPVSRFKIQELAPLVKKLWNLQIVVMTFSILSALLISLGYGYWELIQTDEAGWKDDSSSQLCIRRLKILVSGVFALVRIIVLIFGLQFSRELYNEMVIMDGSNCAGEDETQLTINFLISESANQLDLNIMLMCGVALELFMDLCSLLYSFYVRRKQTKDVNGEMEMGNIDNV